MIPMNNNEIEAMRVAIEGLDGTAKHIAQRLLATVDSLVEKVRLKDDAIVEGMAASYFNDNMEDEKELIREQLQSAMEDDVMAYTQRAEALCLLYKLVEDMRLKPNNKAAVHTFLKKVDELQKDEDPLDELRRNFRTTIGAVLYNEGFTVGIDMERKRVLDLIESIASKGRGLWPSDAGFLVLANTIKERVEKG